MQTESMPPSWLRTLSANQKDVVDVATESKSPFATNYSDRNVTVLCLATEGSGGPRMDDQHVCRRKPVPWTHFKSEIVMTHPYWGSQSIPRGCLI